MAGRESLVHCIGGLGNRTYSVLKFDLLQVVTENRVLKPEFASLRRIRKTTDWTLCRDRTGLEGELVCQINIDQDRRCNDDRRRAFQMVHDGHKNASRTRGTVQTPDRVVNEIAGYEVTRRAFTYDSDALFGTPPHVDLRLARLARVHATNPHLESSTLIGRDPTRRPDGDGHLVLMQGVAAENRLLGNQRITIVAQAPEYKTVVLEQNGRSKWTRKARDWQDLSGSNHHWLRGIARIGHDIHAHRGSGVANTAAPGSVAGILFDKRPLKRAPDGGVGTRELNLAHDHRFGRVKARPTSSALRWRETTERSRRAP